MKKISQRAKSAARKAGFAAVGLIGPAAAFAMDTTDIDTAITEGNTAVTTVVAGVIGIAALVVGIGYVLSTMKRS